MELDIESLKYSISTFQKPADIDKLQIEDWMRSIAEFPQKLHGMVSTI